MADDTDLGEEPIDKVKPNEFPDGLRKSIKETTPRPMDETQREAACTTHADTPNVLAMIIIEDLKYRGQELDWDSTMDRVLTPAQVARVRRAITSKELDIKNMGKIQEGLGDGTIGQI